MGRKLNSDEHLNKIYKSNFGTTFQVIEYFNATNVTIRDLDNNCIIKNVEIGALKNGRIRSPYDKVVYGIGYYGEGNYKAKINGKFTKHYITWSAMMQRCYSKSKERQTYEDCTVCEEWHNFQNFAKWYDENYYEIEGEKMCLDKDILFKGNKIYSPNTCIFVSNRINCLFVKCNKSRGVCPIGVSYLKKLNKYSADCNTTNDMKRIHIGVYNTQEEAFNRYKQFKEKTIKEVAEQYKDRIPQKLYNAMYKYEVNITD